MLDEFLPIFSQVLKDKDQGVYEDFIECLKLYDKAEDGHMIGGELTHILLSLGKLFGADGKKIRGTILACIYSLPVFFFFQERN